MDRQENHRSDMDAMIRVKERGEMMTRCLGKKPPFATPKWDRDCINQNMDHYRQALIEAADELGELIPIMKGMPLYPNPTWTRLCVLHKQMKKSAGVRK
jgi:hypothetical protein